MSLGVTYLHESLKIESHSIPEGEFSTTRPSQESSAFRSPYNHIDRMFDFVQRRVQVPCWNRIPKRLSRRSRRYHLFGSQCQRFIIGLFPWQLIHIRQLHSLGSVFPSPWSLRLCSEVDDAASIGPWMSHSP